jgi:hypothetical protein
LRWPPGISPRSRDVCHCCRDPGSLVTAQLPCRAISRTFDCQCNQSLLLACG